MDWEVELEEEVRAWLETLDEPTYGSAHRHIDRLEAQGALLGEPYTRQLLGKLRELRFHAGGEQYRITYFIAPGGRIVLLTVFRKTRRRERAEILRAEAAMTRCLAEHHAEDEDR